MNEQDDPSEFRPRPRLQGTDERVSDRYRRSVQRENDERRRFWQTAGNVPGGRNPRGQALVLLSSLGLVLGGFPAALTTGKREFLDVLLHALLYLALSAAMGAGIGAWLGEENRRAGAISGAIAMPLTAGVGCLLMVRWGGKSGWLVFPAVLACAGVATVLFGVVRKRVERTPPGS